MSDDQNQFGLVATDVGAHLDKLSAEDRARARAIGKEIARVYLDKVVMLQTLRNNYPDDQHLQERYGTDEKIHAEATTPADDELYQMLRTKSVEGLTWPDLQAIFERDAEEGAQLWRGVLEVAAERLESGIFACDTLTRIDGSMFERAQFLVIRDSLMDDWKPTGAVEMTMVEMLAQSFISYHYWLRLANSMAAREYEAAERKTSRDCDGSRILWETPRLSTADAIDRAINTADRFNRMYLRILRQMRDLRRYSQPVIVKNAGQVNIAADGGQQVNVQESKP